MNERLADEGRAAVYACEIAAFDGTDLEELRPHDSIAALIERVVSAPWWAGPRVRVEAARRGTGSSGTHGPISTQTRAGDTPVTIRLAASQATIATAAHELAHALAGVGHGHDALYRRAYLDVITVITNLDVGDRRGDLHAEHLAAEFAAAGLPVAARGWTSPGDSSGRAIAL